MSDYTPTFAPDFCGRCGAERGLEAYVLVVRSDEYHFCSKTCADWWNQQRQRIAKEAAAERSEGGGDDRS